MTSRDWRTCSSAVKVNLVQTCFVVISLVLAAAIQDMAPQFAGVKPPLLATVALAGVTAQWLPAAGRIFYAIGAGFMADALSDMPPGAMSLFVLGAAAGVIAIRRSFVDMPAGAVFGFTTLALVAPLIEVWLYLWGGAGTEGAILSRALSAAVIGPPIGAAAFAAVKPIGDWLGLPAEEKEARQ